MTGKPLANWQYAVLLCLGDMRYDGFDVGPPARAPGALRSDGIEGAASVLAVATIFAINGGPPQNSYIASITALLGLHVAFSAMSIFLQKPLSEFHPFLSPSLPAFWSKGWHQLFKPNLQSVNYLPLHLCLTTLYRVCAYNPVMGLTGSHGLGACAAFIMSGAVHALQRELLVR